MIRTPHDIGYSGHPAKDNLIRKIRRRKIGKKSRIKKIITEIYHVKEEFQAWNNLPPCRAGARSDDRIENRASLPDIILRLQER